MTFTGIRDAGWLDEADLDTEEDGILWRLDAEVYLHHDEPILEVQGEWLTRQVLPLWRCFRVDKETPHGFWLVGPFGRTWRAKGTRYAHRTKRAALESFRRRQQQAVAWARLRLAEADGRLAWAEKETARTAKGSPS